MVCRATIVRLLITAVVLPIIVLITLGVSQLLSAMNDAVGAAWLARVALVGGVFWLIDLVLLLIALGINAADQQE
jgi:hypothetical protein